MAHDREVGGIRCLEVLDHLSEYLDGDLSDELKQQIEDHLRGCDWCERFGGSFTTTIKTLRDELREPPSISPEAGERLLRVLGLTPKNDG